MLALKRNEAPPAQSVSGIARAVRDGIHTPQPEQPLSPMDRLRAILDNRTVQISLISIISIGGLTIGILASRDVTPPRPTTHVVTPPKAGDTDGAPPLPSLEQPAVVSDGVAGSALRPASANGTVSNNPANAPHLRR